MAEITLPVRADGDQPRARRIPNPATLNAGDVQAQRVQNDPGVAIPQGAFANGEGLVAASKGIASAGEDVYRAGLRQQRLQDANATTEQSLAYDNVSMQEWNRRQVEDDPTRPGYMPDFGKWLGQQAEQHVSALPEGVSDEARQKLRLSLATKQQTLTDAAGRLSLIANQQKAKDLIGAQTNQFAAMATRDPGSLENILAVGEEDLKSYQGTMTPDQFRDAQSRRRGAVTMASIAGHTQQGDYQSAAALIDSKKYDDVLDVPKMTAYVETQQRVRMAAAEAEERRADAEAQKQMRLTQASNFGSVFADALSNKPVDPGKLADMARKQQLTPEQVNAIQAQVKRGGAGQDNIPVLLDLQARATRGENIEDDIYKAIDSGDLKGTTAARILHAADIRGKSDANQVERSYFSQLRTIAGGDAVEKGMLDFGNAAHVAQSQLWSQAQNEWNERVLVKKQDPVLVYSDMAPRYAHPINDQRALPNPRMGSVSNNEDVGVVWGKTRNAFDAGQIDQATLDSEAMLLKQYKTLFDQKLQRAAAAVPTKPGQKPAPLAPGSE